VFDLCGILTLILKILLGGVVGEKGLTSSFLVKLTVICKLANLLASMPVLGFDQYLSCLLQSLLLLELVAPRVQLPH
jgi:hypothetical protein